MSVYRDKERFVYYISVGDMAPARAAAYFTQTRQDFLQQLNDRNHGAMPEGEEWYFVATRGDTKIERL